MLHSGPPSSLPRPREQKSSTGFPPWVIAHPRGAERIDSMELAWLVHQVEQRYASS